MKADQGEKRRGIQIAVVMNNETGSRLETIQKAGQSVLEPTLDKADPFALDLRDFTAEIKCTPGKVPSAQTHSESTGRRSSLARMAFADWVQTNGFG